MPRRIDSPYLPAISADRTPVSAAARLLFGLSLALLGACDDDVHRPSGPADAGTELPAAEVVGDVAAEVTEGDTGDDGASDTAPETVTDAPTLDAPTMDYGTPGDTADVDPEASDDATDADTTDSAEDTAAEVAEVSPDVSPDVPDDIAADAPTDVQGDTGPDVPAGKVPVLFAVGHVGRTVMTCDDGLSWVNNRSYDTVGDSHVCGSTAPVTCFQDGITCDYWSVDNDTCQDNSGENWCDCDHHPGSGTGIAYGDGQFVASFGWGPKGSLRSTADGQALTMVDEGSTFTGVAFGGGRFIAGSRNPKYSDDGGASWQSGTSIDLQSPSGATIWNARQFAYVDVSGGRWVVTGQDSDNVDVQVSSDNGASWWRPTTLPPECGNQARGIAGGGGRIVIMHGSGAVCTSDDGGTSFTLANTGGEVSTTVLFDGSQFLAWNYNTRYSSSDGVAWTATPLAANVNVGPVARNPITGHLVAVRGGWQVWYDDQRFYRSTDGGLTWDEVGDGNYVGSHPVRKIAFGWAEPSAACPL